MIIKYFQIYKRKHRLKIGILKLVVAMFYKRWKEYLETSKREHCRWTFACSKLAIETLIAKHLNTSSARVLLEKVIRKNLQNVPTQNGYEENKPSFSKASCTSIKKEFIHILFLSKFRKISRKKKVKTFRKVINRVCFLLTGFASMDIFTDTF